MTFVAFFSGNLIFKYIMNILFLFVKLDIYGSNDSFSQRLTFTAAHSDFLQLLLWMYMYNYIFASRMCNACIFLSIYADLIYMWLICANTAWLLVITLFLWACILVKTLCDHSASLSLWTYLGQLGLGDAVPSSRFTLVLMNMWLWTIMVFCSIYFMFLVQVHCCMKCKRWLNKVIHRLYLHSSFSPWSSKLNENCTWKKLFLLLKKCFR